MNREKIINAYAKLHPECTVLDCSGSAYTAAIDSLVPVCQIVNVKAGCDEVTKISYMIVAHKKTPILCTIFLDIHGTVELCLDATLKESSELSFSLLYIIHGSGSLTINGQIVHEQAESKSLFVAKGIVNDRATSHVSIKTVIEPQAMNADALQTIKHCVTSDHATVIATPILEAMPDQITCKHGSSIGSFDQGTLLFLQSKGFDLSQAKEILKSAFFVVN